jgi:hypothetical protein
VRLHFASLPRRSDVDYSALVKPANLPELVCNLQTLYAGFGDEGLAPTLEDITAALEAAFYDVDRAAEYLLATTGERRPPPPPAQFSPEDVTAIRGLVAELAAEEGRPLPEENRATLIQLYGVTTDPDPAARRAQVLELYREMAHQERHEAPA